MQASRGHGKGWPELSAAAASGADPHARILIVEDHELMTDALRLLFEQRGYQVTSAKSMSEARAAVDADPPDVALLDVMLPDGDGLELAREWRENGLKTQVLAVSGFADAGMRERCLDAGCRDLLVKPVPIAELLARVGELLAKPAE